MSSSRLPSKVLLPISGKPMLLQVVERVKRADSIDQVVVATSNEGSDDSLEALCMEHDIKIFRGSLEDVLSRYIGAADSVGASTVVRITADCPLTDCRIIDKVVDTFKSMREPDYVSNVLTYTYPRGLDCEVASLAVLKNICQMKLQARHREHVTLFIRENLDQFVTYNVTAEDEMSFPQWRWCVDEAKDFEFVSLIFQELYPTKPNFSCFDVRNLLLAKPELVQINELVTQKSRPHDLQYVF
ncbi:MAG: glycosyltransferase family protein [Candidatus Melainabacteria bacterium]|nr:glycosyltransferase family protein [Candidatus Melainabacteria bacterium]